MATIERMVWNNEDAAGFLPCMFHAMDPTKAEAQIDRNYTHGGGFFKSPSDWELQRPAEVGKASLDHVVYGESFRELSRATLPAWPKGVTPPGFKDEEVRWTAQTIIHCESDFVAIVEEDGSFVVTRMD